MIGHPSTHFLCLTDSVHRQLTNISKNLKQDDKNYNQRQYHNQHTCNSVKPNGNRGDNHTETSHWHRSPFSWPVIMTSSRGPQTADVIFDFALGTDHIGSLFPTSPAHTAINSTDFTPESTTKLVLTQQKANESNWFHWCTNHNRQHLNYHRLRSITWAIFI